MVTNIACGSLSGSVQQLSSLMKLMASLWIPTYPETTAPTIAPNAIAVVRQLEATLHAVAINVDIPDVSNALSTYLLDLPNMIREAEGASRRYGEMLLEAVRKAASQGGVSLTTQTITAHPVLIGDAAAEQSRYFDIGLVGWAPDNESARMTAEALLFGSGRPTLILPVANDVGILDHVVIAWDGSRVAARAVADARPFLKRASKITVVTVTDEKPLPGKDIGERLSQNLRMRGLAVDTTSIRAGDRSIGATLQEHALEIDGKLLVMGGYGHSSVRDFVLGGATDGVLSDLMLPIVLSH